MQSCLQSIDPTIIAKFLETAGKWKWLQTNDYICVNGTSYADGPDKQFGSRNSEQQFCCRRRKLDMAHSVAVSHEVLEASFVVVHQLYQPLCTNSTTPLRTLSSNTNQTHKQIVPNLLLVYQFSRKSAGRFSNTTLCRMRVVLWTLNMHMVKF